MWDFEHPPRNATLAQRYQVHYTQPSLCADELLANRADLGLIPIASLTPAPALGPGCPIASLARVPSIDLTVKQTPGSPEDVAPVLASVRTSAADTACRS